MENPPAWEHLDEETLLDCRVFGVSRARGVSPRDGGSHEVYRIHAPDWVNVIPLTADGQVVMVRQFRHGTREVTLEIPGGMVDPGESPGEAGARELLEETGHASDALVPLGAVHPNPALFGNRCHTFLAPGTRRVGPVRNEGGEDTRVVLVPQDEVPDLMRDGTITHALVIAAFHWHGLSRSG